MDRDTELDTRAVTAMAMAMRDAPGRHEDSTRQMLEAQLAEAQEDRDRFEARMRALQVRLVLAEQADDPEFRAQTEELVAAAKAGTLPPGMDAAELRAFFQR